MTKLSFHIIQAGLTFVCLLLSSCPSHAELPFGQDDSAQTMPLVYRVSIPTPSSQRLHVRIEEDHLTDPKAEFAIPAWAPGYYQILQYQNDIENVHASDGNGRSLPITHPSARVWAVNTEGLTSTPGRIVLEYDVHAHDQGLGFFGSAVEAEHDRAYVNGASAFLYEVGKTNRPVRLETTLPTGWKLATPLDTAPTPVPNANLAKSYVAESYDAFIDCPLQFGKFAITAFDADDVHFQCVCAGGQDWDKARVAAVLKKIVHTAIGVFGKAPFKHYVFFYHVGGAGFEGGLEHHNSTVIHLSENLQDGSSDEFQSVTAHEFFHAWNVKRLRPTGLGPFDYTQPVRTPSLWWAEGVTDYYADLILYRAGLRDRNWLLKDLSNRINELDANPARLVVSLEEASRKAWEGASEGFGGLSYYLKGSLVGLYFDLRLRALTGGRRTLDDVMRLLDTDYGSKSRAYPEEALLAALEAVAQTDLHSEYAALIRTPGDIPWNTALSGAGMTLHRDSASYLGIQLRNERGGANGPLTIDAVAVGSAAMRFPLKPGDSIVSFNGDQVTLDTFRDHLSRLAPHSPVTLQILRDGEPLTLTGDSGARYAHGRLSIDPQRAGRAPVGALFLSTPNNTIAAP